MARVERWLDQGMGECHLRQAEVQRLVVEALHHFDGQTYELNGYVVMPNHVHMLIRPLDAANDSLEKILQSRKRKMSLEVNFLAKLWQEESYDRIVRDAEHLYRCIQYIGDNPRRAGLPPGVCPRWIRSSWRQLGWDFDDK